MTKPKDREGHVSRWPRYYPKQKRERTPVDLWALDPHSHGEVAEKSIANKLDVYVSDFGDAGKGQYPWLGEAIDDESTDVICTPFGGVIGIRVHDGQRSAWIGQARGWGEGEIVSSAFFARLDSTYKLCGVGVHPTPAALGAAVMVEEFAKSESFRQSRPDVWCRRLLLDHGLGGRVDTPALGKHFDLCYEIDRRNAYAASASSPLPIGASVTINRYSKPQNLSQLATWFAQVVVYNPRQLALSPVLYRQSSGLIGSAVTEGWHGLDRAEPIWLWREEVEQAEAAGQVVSVIRGRGWRQTAPLLATWAHRMHLIRSQAPSSIATMVKAAIVAAIGRHGMQPYTYRLVQSSNRIDAQPFVLQGPDPLTGWDIVRDEDYDMPGLSHWYSYILMRNRLELFSRMSLELADGNSVLASNYDAVFLGRQSRLPLEPLELGGWREEARTEADFPYARAVISREKKRTPGLTASSRVELYGR